jgi:hypothetical protein
VLCDATARQDRPKVHANHLTGGRNFGGGDVHDDEQPKLAVSLVQVGGTNLIPDILLHVGGNVEGDPLAALSWGQDPQCDCPVWLCLGSDSTRLDNACLEDIPPFALG